MTITKKNSRPQIPYGMSNWNYMDGRVGFWANIVSVDSSKMRATVVADTGMMFNGIPFATSEWVTKKDGFVSCERNLPEKDARVFVMMPTHTITGAFILCSGYAAGDADTKTLYGSESDKDKKNRIRERVTQSGWKEKEFYENGNYECSSPDDSVSIEINIADDSTESKQKGVELKIFDTTIEIKESGITLKDKNNNKIETSSSGVKITDKNSNVIEMGTSSVKINGNLEVLR